VFPRNPVLKKTSTYFFLWRHQIVVLLCASCQADPDVETCDAGSHWLMYQNTWRRFSLADVSQHVTYVVPSHCVTYLGRSDARCVQRRRSFILLEGALAKTRTIARTVTSPDKLRLTCHGNVVTISVDDPPARSAQVSTSLATLPKGCR